MALHLTTFSLIVWILSTVFLIQAQDNDEANPAFKIRVTTKGLQFISRIAKRMLTDFLKDGEGKSIETKSGDATLQWSNLKIQKYNDALQSEVLFTPGIGVEYMLQDLSAKMTSDYKVVQSGSSRGPSASGAFLITMNGVAVSLLISMLNSGGHFKPQLENCVCTIEHADLKVTKGSAKDLKKHFKDDIINNQARRFMQEQVCAFARTIFLPKIERTFAGFPIIGKIFGHVYYNYSLTRDPVVNADNVIASYAGNAFIRHSNGFIDSNVPFTPPPIVDGQCPDRMMCLFMSNYSIRSLIFLLAKQHRFDYNFTKDTTPSLAKNLRTQCSKDDICAGSVIKELESKYPDSHLEIHIQQVIGQEKIKIRKDVVNVTGEGVVTGYIRKPNGEREWLFSCNEESFTTMKKPVFNAANYTVSTTLDANHFNLYNVTSSMPDINAESLSMLTGYSMDNYVTPDLSRTIGRGLRLPKLIEFNLVNGLVSFEDDVIIMGSDFCQTQEECHAGEKEAVAQASKTAKPDYEDAYDGAG